MIHTPNMEKCEEAPISNNIGTDNQVFVRDAKNATRPNFADSGGIAVPFSALSAVHDIMRFWFGQIIPHTLSIIINPSPPPRPIAYDLLLP